MLLLAARGLPRLSGRDLAVLALQAFTGIFLFTTLLLYGLTQTSAAASGIVTSTTPAVAGLLSVVLLGERLMRARAGGPNPLLGNPLVFGAVVGEDKEVEQGDVKKRGR